MPDLSGQSERRYTLRQALLISKGDAYTAYLLLYLQLQ
jgi:hypothetical protein